MDKFDVYASIPQDVDAKGNPQADLPSLATQWRQDWANRVRVMVERGVIEPGDLVQRAPQQFIETGVWPVDVPRP